MSVAVSTGVQLAILFYFRFSSMLLEFPGMSSCHAAHCICRVFMVLFVIYLSYRDDSLTS